MDGNTATKKDAAGPKGSAASTYLRIAGLTKSFGAFTALRDIDLTVAQGEFVCFLGPSGCGKTTLLRCIAGLETQSAGRIEQAGRDISTLPPSQRDFGIVFQSYALFPNLNVADNVGYGLRSRGQSRAEIKARVAELLDLVGMPDATAKYPAQLSGGQQQRVALARALATSPGLLLLDEPLSALDARVRLRLRHEIRSVQRRLGLTTIMVTHDQEEALTMADRIVVMNHGVIDQVGTPQEIYRRPRTPFVADFVGTMNFIQATVRDGRSVSLGARQITCSDEHGLAAGTKVQLCLRPEDVQVRGVDSATVNALPVKVQSVDFLGSFGRAELKPEDPAVPPLIADFSANLLRDLHVVEGGALTIALPPDRLRVFQA